MLAVMDESAEQDTWSTSQPRIADQAEREE
jgi:hypothetical protein